MANIRSMIELSALLAAEETAKASTANKGYVPFWNMLTNSTMLVRFLCDRDDSNPWPWAERRTIKMPFQGMIHSDYDTDGEVLVTVPCPETWGLKCAVTQAIRPFWKGSEAEVALARRYYRKPSYIMGGFLVSSPMPETSVPENPIRLFALNKSIHGVIKQTMMDVDFEDHFCNTDATGRDFKITKGQRGQYADYTTSRFVNKPRALNPAELAALEQFGLPNLSAELGPKPSDAQIAAMLPLYQASLAGEPFDNAVFGAFFKAYPVRSTGNGHAAAEPVAPVTDEQVAQAAAFVKDLRPKTTTVAA